MPQAMPEKATIRAEYDANGSEAAQALAQTMGIKPGTVRVWLTRWQTEFPGDNEPVLLHQAASEFLAYPTEAEAKRAATARCTASGMDARCLSVIENKGRWELVPRHLDPSIIPETIPEGSRVRCMTDGKLGVLGIGVVHFDDGSSSTVMSTHYLQLSDAPLPRKKLKPQVKDAPPAKLKGKPVQKKPGRVDQRRKKGKK